MINPAICNAIFLGCIFLAVVELKIYAAIRWFIRALPHTPIQSRLAQHTTSVLYSAHIDGPH